MPEIVEAAEAKEILLKNLEEELIDLINDKKLDQLKECVEKTKKLNCYWELSSHSREILKIALDRRQFQCYGFLYKSGFLLKNGVEYPFGELTWKEKCDLSDEIHKYLFHFI